jgi:hypothetical protein
MTRLIEGANGNMDIQSPITSNFLGSNATCRLIQAETSRNNTILGKILFMKCATLGLWKQDPDTTNLVVLSIGRIVLPFTGRHAKECQLKPGIDIADHLPLPGRRPQYKRNMRRHCHRSLRPARVMDLADFSIPVLGWAQKTFEADSKP